MKACHNLCMGTGLIFSILLTACVNHISEEEEVWVNNGDIPLKFVAAIHEITHTRVINNKFEEGDAVGLFALSGNTTMQEERYADNLHFIRSSENEFTSGTSVYYPEDGVTLNLISYYPYQEEGVEMGKSKMPVSVATEQNVSAGYTRSDFLIATREDVLASKEPISLTYNHQFFRLKIVLVPGEGEDIEAILSANPKLSVYGFYTKTNYDFQKTSYSGYSEEKAITPFGEWQIKEERLIGKELILIPQQTTEGHQYILVEAEGKKYVSLLPSNLQLQEGKQRELEITFATDQDILMSKVTGEIGEWEGAEVDPAESVTLHKYVDVSQLTFEHSNVCKVLSAGKQVAEICKEYLVTPGFSSQAIIAYPMKKDETVNLSQGVVMQLLQQSGKVHGGTVSWNAENHSLMYLPGTLPPCKKLYVMADGKISLSASTADDILPVLTLDEVVRDGRGGIIHNYPLVKIGTQYWMRDNLEASLYINGEEVSKLDSVHADTAGYLQSATKHYFYTASVALSDEFLPAHWGLPSWEDWNILKSYLKDNASLVKSGAWMPLNKGEAVQPANNLSGFNGLPVGMYVGKFQAEYENKHLAYWTLNDPKTAIADKAFYLRSNMNTIGESAVNVDTKAFAIRCIRK